MELKHIESELDFETMHVEALGERRYGEAGRSESGGEIEVGEFDLLEIRNVGREKLQEIVRADEAERDSLRARIVYLNKKIKALGQILKQTSSMDRNLGPKSMQGLDQATDGTKSLTAAKSKQVEKRVLGRYALQPILSRRESHVMEEGQEGGQEEVPVGEGSPSNPFLLGEERLDVLSNSSIGKFSSHDELQQAYTTLGKLYDKYIVKNEEGKATGSKQTLEDSYKRSVLLRKKTAKTKAEDRELSIDLKVVPLNKTVGEKSTQFATVNNFGHKDSGEERDPRDRQRSENLWRVKATPSVSLNNAKYKTGHSFRPRNASPLFQSVTAKTDKETGPSSKAGQSKQAHVKKTAKIVTAKAKYTAYEITF